MKKILFVCSLVAILGMAAGCAQKTCPTYAKKHDMAKHK